MALHVFKRAEEHRLENAPRPPKKPEADSANEADLLRYGDELLDYLEKRYPLPRNEEGAEIVTRF